MQNHKLKILAVDDIQDNLITLKAVIEDAFPDATFLSAMRGSEAIALTLVEDPDVILLDIVMPEMDGFEVCRRLKADERVSHIPVIFLTALQTGRASRIAALEAGGEGFLAKPLDEPELTAQIRAMVKIKRAAVAQREEKDRLSDLVEDRTRKLHVELAARQLTESKLTQSVAALQVLNQSLQDAQRQLIQSEKLASMGQLAAGVAHEINNPISFVQSNFSSLAEYVDDLLAIDAAYREVEGQLGSQHQPAFERVRQLKQKADFDFIVQDLRKLVGESREGLERVSKIVHDLKNFARADDGDWQWVDLHQGIDSTLNIVANEIKYKAEVVREYGQIPQVHCISSQINQVFMNLLVNAAQAIGEHGHITIHTGSAEQQVWVEVKDDGSGIPPENFKRIFDPFFTTKPIGDGTGLGLSICWGIIQRHNGKIEVESELGKGTTFRMTLPIDAQA